MTHRTIRRVGLVLAAGAILAIGWGGWWISWYDNYHPVIAGELYRSGQMSAARFRSRVTSDGIATVINLRANTNASWYVAERGVAGELGITYIDIPFPGHRAPDDASLRRLVDEMEAADRPLLIHCRHGADRTGMAVALYLSHVKGEPPDVAHRGLSLRYGHLPVTRMRWYDDAFFSHSIDADVDP